MDFGDLPRAIPSAGSSAGSVELLAALNATVVQYPEVVAVVYRIAGSCSRFWNCLRRECRVVERRRPYAGAGPRISRFG